MRALTASITNALAASDRTPALSVQLYDPLQHYALYQSTGGAEGLSAACVAADGSIVRCYTDHPAGAFAANLFVQRITDPSIAAQWSTWTTLSAANMLRDAGCAISNNGGTLRVFAQSGTGPNFNLQVWTSSNNGASWTGPVTITAVSNAIRGIGSAGNNDVFWAVDDVGGESLHVATITGGVWSAPATWTLGVLPSCLGLDVTWNAGGSIYYLAVSDGEQILGYSYLPSGPTWAAFANPLIAPIDAGAAIGLARAYPRLQQFDGFYSLSYLEVDTGAFTGLSYSYARLRQSTDFIHWSDGFLLSQRFSFGPTWLKAGTPPAGAAGPGYYLTENVFTWRANTYNPANPAQFQDVTAQVVEAQRKEIRGKPDKLTLRLSNAGGQYNSLSMLGLNTSIALAEGYNDPGTGVPSTIAVGIYYVDSITYVRGAVENELIIQASNGLKKLGEVTEAASPGTITYVTVTEHDRTHTTKGTKKKPPVTTTTTTYTTHTHTVRYQQSYTSRTLQFLLTDLAAKAGIFLTNFPGTSQFSQVVPYYAIPTGHTIKSALDELCSIYAVVYFLDQAETMQFREKQNSDPSVWTYQPEIEALTLSSLDLRANHIIVTGRSTAGALVYGESYDFAHIMQTQQERTLNHTDLKLTTLAEAQLKAAFLLAEEQRKGGHYAVSVPSHPGLQLNDVITLTDYAAPQGTGQTNLGRIIQQAMTYDPEQAEYHLACLLEAP